MILKTITKMCNERGFDREWVNLRIADIKNEKPLYTDKEIDTELNAFCDKYGDRIATVGSSKAMALWGVRRNKKKHLSHNYLKRGGYISHLGIHISIMEVGVEKSTDSL